MNRTISFSLFLGLAAIFAGCTATRPSAQEDIGSKQLLKFDNWNALIAVSPDEDPASGTYSIRISHNYFMLQPVTQTFDRNGQIHTTWFGNLDEDINPELLVCTKGPEGQVLALDLYDMVGGQLYPDDISAFSPDSPDTYAGNEEVTVANGRISVCYTDVSTLRHCSTLNLKTNTWQTGQ